MTVLLFCWLVPLVAIWAFVLLCLFYFKENLSRLDVLNFFVVSLVPVINVVALYFCFIALLDDPKVAKWLSRPARSRNGSK